MSGADDLFDDGKDKGAFRTIGEVAGALGIKPHVLRYWEEQFPMLKPVKRSGQRRYYRPDDVELLQKIDRLLNHEGYTIKGALRALKSGQAGEGAASGSSDSAQSSDSGQPSDSGQSSDPATPAEPDLRLARKPEPELVARLQRIRETLAGALVKP